MLIGMHILVTGAASGIGRATCLLAAEEGALGVIAVDRSAEGLAGLEAELSAMGVPCEAVVGDMSQPELPARAVTVAIERFGGFHAAVNNAGISGRRSTLAEMDDAVFEEVVDINLRSVYRCLRAQLPHLYSRGGGAIVNIASATISGTMESIGPYVASKFGVVGLSKVASKEAGPHGVRVNVVAPGRTDTPLLRAQGINDPTFDVTSLTTSIPLGRFADAREVAQPIVFLCSDRASFITGSTLVVDGGRVG